MAALPNPIPNFTPSAKVRRLQIDELPGHLATLEADLAGEGRIELLRGDTIVAELRAVGLQTPEKQKAAEMPDFMGRLKQMWGDKPLDVDTTAWVREDRDGDDRIS